MKEKSSERVRGGREGRTKEGKERRGEKGGKREEERWDGDSYSYSSFNMENKDVNFHRTISLT